MRFVRATPFVLVTNAIACSTKPPVTGTLVNDLPGSSGYSQWGTPECTNSGGSPDDPCSAPCRPVDLYVSLEPCSGYSELKTGCTSGVSNGWRVLRPHLRRPLPHHEGFAVFNVGAQPLRTGRPRSPISEVPRRGSAVLDGCWPGGSAGEGGRGCA